MSLIFKKFSFINSIPEDLGITLPSVVPAVHFAKNKLLPQFLSTICFHLTTPLPLNSFPQDHTAKDELIITTTCTDNIICRFNCTFEINLHNNSQIVLHLWTSIMILLKINERPSHYVEAFATYVQLILIVSLEIFPDLLLSRWLLLNQDHWKVKNIAFLYDHWTVKSFRSLLLSRSSP